MHGLALLAVLAQQPAAPAAQAPPDTEIYLAAITRAPSLAAAVNITTSPGYDNQPFFTADGKTLLFTSARGGRQTDIYRYDLATKQTTRVTDTPESEYSPTVTPDGGISVVRVEADGTQRLWRFEADGKNPRVLLPDVKPVGYHAWIDGHTIALFVLGSPATLQVADTTTGRARVVASDIGRWIAAEPHAPGKVGFVQRDRGDRTRLSIHELDATTGQITPLVDAVAGNAEADCAWAPSGELLMVSGGKLYSWSRKSGWTASADLELLGLKNATRLAVSPDGKYLAIVAAPPKAR